MLHKLVFSLKINFLLLMLTHITLIFVMFSFTTGCNILLSQRLDLRNLEGVWVLEENDVRLVLYINACHGDNNVVMKASSLNSPSSDASLLAILDELTLQDTSSLISDLLSDGHEFEISGTYTVDMRDENINTIDIHWKYVNELNIPNWIDCTGFAWEHWTHFVPAYDYKLNTFRLIAFGHEEYIMSFVKKNE